MKEKDTLGEKGKLSSLQRLNTYLRPYKTQLIGALIALVFSSSVVLGLGGAIKYLIDYGISRNDVHLLDRSFLMFIGLTLGLAVATYARYYLVSWIGEKVVADLRRDVYSRLLRLHTAFFETARTGELLSRITTDTTLLQSVVGSTVSVALRNLILFFGGAAMMLHSSPRLSGYVALIVPLVIFPIVVIGRQVRRLSRVTQGKVADLSSHAEETLAGIRTIQAFALEEYESKRFVKQVDISMNAALSRIRVRAMLTALVIALVFGAIMTVLWIGGRSVMQHHMSSGELTEFIFYSIIVASSAGAISDVVGELQRAAGATERLMELLSYQSDIVESANPVALPKPLRGEINFEDVIFHYPSRPDKPAIEKLSLTIEPGETIALVGPSGAGKTTLFQLLLRFYDPASGRITIDGVDIRDTKFTDLRSHIAIVPQDPVIFSANAWDNIRCGKQDAPTKDVIAAAAGAGAIDFLEKLPDGLDTHLGEKGVRLSGGQKQRIAIARAMIRNPRILLLDEATSALDSENEHKVQQALERLMQGRTTLVIAHRLSTVQNASRIAVINEGKLEAIGKHEELLAKSPLYARLAKLQFKVAA
ncbi:MAG TPA: ABC transporter transmembrane domain-containing protein [Rickettsiales bacterium]|nr:ABC transporter transmembrane domain-containing protein [Rickettsiales bacterium]